MNPLRLSIAQLMSGIAIGAGGLYIIQIDRNDPDFYRFWHEYVIGVVPMACLLLLGLIAGLDSLVRRSKCHAFLAGFEMIGWASLFLYASFLAVNYHQKYRTLSRLMPLTHLFFPNGCAYADIPVMTLHMAVLFLAEFLVSLAGGLLFVRLGISVVREPPSRIG
jgi:hypothetical protein